jgi:small-conductance mechanosensitive channel
MFSYTLFNLGPYEVCLWNLIFLSTIIFISILLRRVIHKNLKRLLSNQNIQVEGRKATLLRLLSQSIYILTFYACIYSFGFNNHDVSFENFLSYTIIKTAFLKISFAHILGILVVVFGARMLINFVRLYFTRRVKGRKDLDAGSEFVYIQVTKYIIYVIGFILCLQILQVELSVLLGGSAALLVGLGLGLQDVFRDMFSGFVILFEGNLRVGDIVEIYNSGNDEPVIAKLVKIKVRTTQIETRNGNVLVVPNSKLTQGYVENWSHGSHLSRFIIDVSIAYGSNTELVKDLLKRAAMAHPRVNKSESIFVRLKNFGENGLELELVFWAEQSWDANNYKSEIRFEIDRLFREHKITIPFPQRDMRIQNISAQGNQSGFTD